MHTGTGLPTTTGIGVVPTRGTVTRIRHATFPEHPPFTSGFTAMIATWYRLDR
jgi:hypothetical protein